MLGWPVSTLTKKRREHLRLTLDLDRQLENIELLVRLGGVPAGAPIWLQRSLLVGRGWPALAVNPAFTENF